MQFSVLLIFWKSGYTSLMSNMENNYKKEIRNHSLIRFTNMYVCVCVCVCVCIYIYIYIYIY